MHRMRMRKRVNDPMSKDKSSETRGVTAQSRGKKDSKTRAQTLGWIMSVREGSQESFSSLLERYRPLIEGAVSRFANDGITELAREDLRQEASLSFYQSILTYDPEQTEVEFGLYAKICINNALVSRMRKLKQRRPDEPLPEEIGDWQGAGDPAEPVLEQERMDALYKRIRGVLSDYECRVWSLYMAGRSAKGIGEIVGKDEKSVTNAIYRIRKKLRAELNEIN